MNSGFSPRANDLSYPIPVQFMANLHGLVVGVAGGHLPAFWVALVAIALSAAVWLLVARMTSGYAKPVEAFPTAIAASVLVSYYLFLHDLSVLLIPIAVLLDWQAEPGFAHEPSHHVAGWIAFFGLCRNAQLSFHSPVPLSDFVACLLFAVRFGVARLAQQGQSRPPRVEAAVWGCAST